MANPSTSGPGKEIERCEGSDEKFAAWFDQPGLRSFMGTGRYFEGDPPVLSLDQILAIDGNDAKPFCCYVITSKDKLPENVDGWLTRLGWAIRAYSQFQDILAVTVGERTPELINRHYCYYESLVYLRQTVVACLDRNFLSSLTLLRPFLELVLFHCYWHLRCEPGDYRKYYRWLRGQSGKPPFSQILGYVFESLPTKAFVGAKRVALLRETLHGLYKSLCTYNHTPRLEESITAFTGPISSRSMEAFFYSLISIEALLNQVVYLMVLCYPMSLFPVERYRKWGFQGPVGMFFDRCNFAILRKYIGEQNVAVLRRGLASAPEVQSLTKWFRDLPLLSEDELDASWHAFRSSCSVAPEQPQGADLLPMRLLIAKAHQRSLGLASNYVTDKLPLEDIPDQLVRSRRERMRSW